MRNMKFIVSVITLIGAVIFSATDASAMSVGNSHHLSIGSSAAPAAPGPADAAASVPKPSTLYALTAGLGLVGGAGWFLRRRK